MNVFRTCVATAIFAVALAGLFAVPSQAQANPTSNYLNPLPTPIADIYVYQMSWTNLKTGQWSIGQYEVTRYRANGYKDWGELGRRINYMRAVNKVSPGTFTATWAELYFWKCVYPDRPR